METKTADGSEITNIESEEIFPNYGNAENCSAHDVESVSELLLELVEAAPVADGTSNIDNKSFDVEENLDLGKQMSINDQDEEKMQIEENVSLKRMLNLALNKNEDALKELSRLKTFESEVTKLTKLFTEDVSDVLQFEDDSNQVEKLAGIIKYALELKENELGLKQQFANAELQIKKLEDKLDVQSNLLQQEIKTRALKKDELNNTNDRLSRLETDLKCLKTNALDLEGRLKTSMDESEEFKQLAGQIEEDCMEAFERALELDNLLVISKSRTKEMEQVVTSFQKETSEFYQKPGSNEHTQELFNETEMELAKLSTQARFVQDATARVNELEHLLGFQVNDAETELEATKENYACEDPEVGKLSKKLNLLVVYVKELDDQASHAKVSELAKEIELQVLYAKLAEMDIIVQKLQANVLVAETRARTAETDRAVLASINSKVDKDFRNLQARVNEVLAAINQIDNDKQSIAFQLTSTTKNINDLTKKIADERQHLQKQLSFMVKDNLELTKKYMKVRNELDILLSEHESHQKNSKEREETHMEDLKVGCCEDSNIDTHEADLQQKLQFGGKLEQDLWRVSTTTENFGGSHLPAESTDIKSENASKCQAASALGSESFASANSVWNFSTYINSMAVVVLVVAIVLVISKLV